MREDEDDFGDEPVSLGPGGILSGVFIAVMGIAIFYNAAFRQEPTARSAGNLPDLTKKFIEISSDTAKKKPAKSQDRMAVTEPAEADRSATGALAAVQDELIALGMLDGSADGRDRQTTRKAIARYQRENGLAVTGTADQKLLDHLRFTRQVIAASEVTDSVTAPESDERVRTAQTGLAELGYRPGTIDGFLGEATREAIRQFQRDRNLAQSGEVTDELLEELRDVSGVSQIN